MMAATGLSVWDNRPRVPATCARRTVAASSTRRKFGRARGRAENTAALVEAAHHDNATTSIQEENR